MGEWFDIETAPKNATPILIIGNDLRFDCLSYCAAFWGAGAWHNDIDGSVLPEYYEPTHWQPLPEPPNQLKGTELIMTTEHTKQDDVWELMEISDKLLGCKNGTLKQMFDAVDTLRTERDALKAHNVMLREAIEHERNIQTIAESLCNLHLTDGFCRPGNKQDCRCWNLAKSAHNRMLETWPLGKALSSTPTQAAKELRDKHFGEAIEAFRKAYRELGHTQSEHEWAIEALQNRKEKC